MSQLTWVWALVFTFFSSGLFVMGMALHISFWVRQKRKVGFAFFLYLLVTLILILDFVPDRYWPSWTSSEVLTDFLGICFVALWFGAAFALRRELMQYYASPQGGTLEIKPLWTALFSVFYINYCLWVVRDSA